MQITIVSVGAVEQAAKGKAKWEQFELVYRGNKGEQKKTVRSFEAGVFTTLKDAEVGVTYDVKVVKEGEYWQWKEATVAEKEQNAGTTNEVPVAKGSKAKVGDWETSEERAKKQTYIVRQSTISNALEHAGLVGLDKPSLTQILEIAATFERHVFDKNVASEQPVAAKALRAKVTKEVEVK